MIPEKLMVIEVIFKRGSRFCAIPFSGIGVLMLYPDTG
jgi:hypothetical protein